VAGEEPTVAAPTDGMAATDVLLSEPARASNDALDTDFDNVFNNDSSADADMGAPAEGLSLNGMSVGGGSGFNDFSPDMDQNLTAALTLKDHLESQLVHLQLTPAQQMIARFLIDMVDEAGYLRGELATVSEKLDCRTVEVEAVLVRLQSFEPAGVFARN